MKLAWIWMLIMIFVPTIIIATVLLRAQAQQPPGAPPAVPAIVSPQATTPAAVAEAPPTTGTNLAQWIVLCSAMAGAFIIRKNDQTAPTMTWSTLRDVLVTGGATYVLMDLAAELGFLQTYMAAVTKKPLTLGVVTLLLSMLGGAGVVKGIQGIINNAVGLLGGGTAKT